MIYIKRPKCSAISIYSRPSVAKQSSEEREIDKAVGFFTDKSNYKNNVKLCQKSFTFRVYKDAELAKELQALFGGKCAYCESNYAHVTPKEVEHFRPKAEIEMVKNSSVYPGYFWLAAEWTNLLISCVDCNRVRNHDVPGQSKRVRLGKGAQFPLDDEKLRVRKHGRDLSGEERVRLLIDPCREDPEKLLKFDDEGLIHPVYGPSAFKGKKAKTSIDVYALQRKPLVEERKRTLNRFICFIGLLRHLLDNHNTFVTARVGHEKIDANLTQINNLQVQMQEMLAKDAPYLAMLRDYIARGEENNQFADLKRLGVELTTLL